ncbi:MAG: hypothetical protein M3R17_09730 [Bacteroidota bacterium]|nr:hypothetical protein [Bacteroidota bacterium]
MGKRAISVVGKKINTTGTIYAVCDAKEGVIITFTNELDQGIVFAY